MKATLTILLALTFSSPALAQGFTAADLGQAAQRADATPFELARATEELRLGLAYDSVLALGNRSEAERQMLIRAFPTGEGAGDFRMQWFMAGAIAQPSQGNTTVLYNPLARGTLALDWTKEGEDWRVSRAWLSSSGPAQWPATSEPWRRAFAADYAVARAFPGDAGRDFVATESGRWLVSLADALRDPGRRGGIEAAQALIRRGRTARAGGGLIDVMPEGARAAYGPVAAIPRGDGGLAVIFGSPLLPQLLIAGDFAGGGALEKLSLINLDNVGEVK